MKRVLWIVAPALAAALAAPAAFAGGDHACTASTQECLDMMAKQLHSRGWMGIEIDDSAGQLLITKVVASSPAEDAGLEAGDVLLAVNGVVYAPENKEKLTEIRSSMTPGKVFTYQVQKEGKGEKEIEVTLGNIPDDVLAQWVGAHMLEHAHAEQAEE